MGCDVYAHPCDCVHLRELKGCSSVSTKIVDALDEFLKSSPLRVCHRLSGDVRDTLFAEFQVSEMRMQPPGGISSHQRLGTLERLSGLIQ